MRNKNVDLLRFIGLALIILAHVDPPQIVFQLRNFDVPLMVMIAGVSFGLSYRQESYGAYLWKRINRLVFPVWIFLTFYFTLLFTYGYPTKIPSFEIIVSSYLLLSGIGYVWIIRVFLLVALAAPLIWTISDHIGSNTRYLTVCGVVYIAYEVLMLITKSISDSYVGTLLEITLNYLLPYGIVFAVGLRLPSMTRQQIRSLCIGAFTVFILICGALYTEAERFVPTQNYKYPPTAYYLSFALACSTFLWLFSGRLLLSTKSKYLWKSIEFIAQNSIWIYLWHILMIDIIHFWFLIKYPLVFLLATLIVLVQVTCVNRLILTRLDSITKRKFIQTLFTG